MDTRNMGWGLKKYIDAVFMVGRDWKFLNDETLSFLL